MLDYLKQRNYTINDLLEIMVILRSENGCPWDREQTHESIRRNLLEEAYEAVEAIDEGDSEHLREELGDVLLQVVFHSRMEEEAGRFSFDGVCDGVCKKLIERHPHIFGDVKADTSEQVLKNWDDIKQGKKGHTTAHEGMLAVAKSLPALIRSEKVQFRAAKVGFDWPDVSGAMDKLYEETNELREAVSGGNAADMEDELGDLLFSAVNVARFCGVDPENALSRACDKFMARFGRVEQAALQSGRKLSDMTLSEMDALWDEIKQSGI